MNLNQIVLGIVTGSYYSIVALGLVLVYKVSGIVNFAFGNMGMLTVYIALQFLEMNLNPFLAFALVIPISMLMGYLVERFTMRPLKRVSHGSMLIVTLALMMILEGLVIQVWGADYKGFPELVTGKPFLFRILGGLVLMRRQDILTLSILTLVSIFLLVTIRFTKFGLAIRATSEDEDVARLMGVDTARISSFVWMISAVLSTTVAILGAPRTYVSPGMMIHYQIEGFTAAVLGGFESISGAVVGGLLLGVIENFVSLYLANEFKPTISLLVIIAVLMVKPEGIFGGKRGVRV